MYKQYVLASCGWKKKYLIRPAQSTLTSDAPNMRTSQYKLKTNLI